MERQSPALRAADSGLTGAVAPLVPGQYSVFIISESLLAFRLNSKYSYRRNALEMYLTHFVARRKSYFSLLSPTVAPYFQ